MDNNICAVILGAGEGTRLGYPNQMGGKAMVPVGGKPLIEHCLNKIAPTIIKDVAIVANPTNYQPMANYLGNGEKWGLNITYIIQETPLGIAHALGLCQSFVGERKVFLMLGDNLFYADFDQEVQEFALNGTGACVFLCQVENPEDYGVAQIQGDKIINLVEKPPEFISNWGVTGAYLYDAKAFDYIPTLTPSARGELEITDLNKCYLAANQLKFSKLAGWWLDVGTPKRLDLAVKLLG